MLPRRLPAANTLPWRIESDAVLRSSILERLHGCLDTARTEVAALGRRARPTPAPARAGPHPC